jgi:hypothetical protein
MNQYQIFKHFSCSTWVEGGFCSNTYYTCQNYLSYCSFSCNVASCNPQTACLPNNTAPAPAPGAKCVDNSTYCSEWASSGFCTNNFYSCSQIQSNCASTCNIGSCNPQTTCNRTSTTVSPGTLPVNGPCQDTNTL